MEECFNMMYNYVWSDTIFIFSIIKQYVNCSIFILDGKNTVSIVND